MFIKPCTDVHSKACLNNGLPKHSSLHFCCVVGLGVTVITVEFDLHVDINGPYGVISTVYVSPGCTPNSVTLVLLTVIGDWSELTLCLIR